MNLACSAIFLVSVMGIQNFVVCLEDDLNLIPDTWKINAAKKNTWWSKKSLPLEEDTSNLDSYNQDSTNCASVISSVGCYVDACVTSFLECCRLADNKPMFLRCRQGHRKCMMGCFRDIKSLHSFFLINGL